MNNADSVSKIPLIGSELGDMAKMREKYLMGGARAMYNAGYSKFKGSMYRVPSPRGANGVWF